MCVLCDLRARSCLWVIFRVSGESKTCSKSFYNTAIPSDGFMAESLQQDKEHNKALWVLLYMKEPTTVNPFVSVSGAVHVAKDKTAI